MIYRIIHELVNNALKHSGATKITINVMHEKDYIAFTVYDNGCGFDKEIKTQGMGLANIRNRVAACNGNVETYSTAGEGTEISIHLPL
jgi:signal transduction histidine kinase